VTLVAVLYLELKQKDVVMKKNINQIERLCKMGRFLNIRLERAAKTGVRYSTHHLGTIFGGKGNFNCEAFLGA
jgi:hypothetical protein